MIEQFLQASREFAKEIWFQLDYRFHLEDTETFKLLEPYIIQIQDNPLYLVASIATLFLVPYSLLKVRSLSRDRERKLDELIEEMEEEYGEDDPRRLRRPEANDKTDTPLTASTERVPSPYTKIIDEVKDSNDIEGKLDILEDEFSESHNDTHNIEPKEKYDEDDPRRLRRPETNDKTDTLNIDEVKDSNDIEGKLDILEDEFSESHNDTHNIEPKEKYDEDDPRRLRRPETNDKTDTLNKEGKELADSQLIESQTDKNLDELILGENITPLIDDTINGHEDIRKPQDDFESTELQELPSEKDALANNSELPELNEDEQDKEIKGLQDEMERAINQHTQQTEESSIGSSSIKDLNQIDIEEGTADNNTFHEDSFIIEDAPLPETESLDTQIDEPFIQEESAISDAEVLAAEILATLEPEFEEPVKLDEELELEKEDKTEQLIIPKTRDYESELSASTFEVEPDISSEELEFSNENSTPEAQTKGFEEILDSRLNTERSPLTNDLSPPEGSDSLIDRLKFLQTRFENRFQPTEQPIPKTSVPIEKSIPEKEYARFTAPRRHSSVALSPDSKKYMDLLESFVFMKDQQKHK